MGAVSGCPANCLWGTLAPARGKKRRQHPVLRGSGGDVSVPAANDTAVNNLFYSMEVGSVHIAISSEHDMRAGSKTDVAG